MKIESILKNAALKESLFNDQETMYYMMMYSLIARLFIFSASISGAAALFVIRPDFFGYYLFAAICVVGSLKALFDFREYFRYFINAFIIIYGMLLYFSRKEDDTEFNQYLVAIKPPFIKELLQTMLRAFKKEGLSNGIIK